ncbi:MAG: 4Fe-4S binding protein [Methanophagales archaeon]|nr:4Fe-4S binding protein [Methanophagales archaeon]
MWIPVVDLRVCKGCGDCVQVCPDGALKIVDKKLVVDYNKCSCCGVCDRICKWGALELKSPQLPQIAQQGVRLAGLRAEVKKLKQELRETRRAVKTF